MNLKLYTSHRNSAGERVRIALNLKGVAYEYVAVPAMPSGAYRKVNVQGLMPALEVDGAVIPQSAAILDFVDRAFPEPPLLPPDTVRRAQAIGFAQLVTGEMHARTMGRVRNLLGGPIGVDSGGITAWMDHWLTEGFDVLEETLARRPEAWPFCFGDTPGWADLHLVPQLGNGRRFGCDLAGYPRLLEVEARCAVLEAFRNAAPERQPDFPRQSG